MQTHDESIQRIQAETIVLKDAILSAVNAHGERYGWIDPQVVVSALGSTAIDLFTGLSQSAYPREALGGLVTCADAYFRALSSQIALAAAGGQVTASRVTVVSPGPVPNPTHDGGRA